MERTMQGFYEYPTLFSPDQVRKAIVEIQRREESTGMTQPAKSKKLQAGCESSPDDDHDMFECRPR